MHSTIFIEANAKADAVTQPCRVVVIIDLTVTSYASTLIYNELDSALAVPQQKPKYLLTALGPTCK